MSNPIDECVSLLLEAQKAKIPCAPIRNTIGIDNLDTAYAIQDKISLHRQSQGEVIIGKKIGLTSVAVQKQLGVDQPDYGMLFNTMEVMNGGEVAWSDLMQPKVEAEVAFVLKEDLPSPKTSIATVLAAIDFAVPAIEIVGSRVENWDIRITDTIADNASASHFVIGHQIGRLEMLDLVSCEMTLNVNGKVVSQGKGADCLGSPINATWWLANKMAALGNPLKKGDLVLAGALGPMAAVHSGDHVDAQIEGLGSVSVTFANR